MDLDEQMVNKKTALIWAVFLLLLDWFLKLATPTQTHDQSHHPAYPPQSQ